MHDPRGVHDLQRFADLMRVVHGIRFADRMLQALAQAAAGKVLQRQIQIVIRGAEIEHIRQWTGDSAWTEFRIPC